MKPSLFNLRTPTTRAGRFPAIRCENPLTDNRPHPWRCPRG
ncbi:hypothetical protein STTU_p0072 (plasmid) [Streptomyces sp. Tu6071]|nr:hypothetical protein STTU_p0072 [Streptomyces sp. Tu6071]